MNNQARRRVQFNHYLFQSNQHLENYNRTAYDCTEHFYDANTPIATVRCFWQHIVSSTVGADLVNIHVFFTEVEGWSDSDVLVQNRHRDVTPVTIGYLAGQGVNNINNNPDFRLRLRFDYFIGIVVNDFHCICIN